jgi:hypothetical protein
VSLARVGGTIASALDGRLNADRSQRRDNRLSAVTRGGKKRRSGGFPRMANGCNLRAISGVNPAPRKRDGQRAARRLALRADISCSENG